MFNISMTNSLLSSTGWLVGMLLAIVFVAVALAAVLVVALKPIKKYQVEEDDAIKKLDRRETEITIKLLEHSTNPEQTEALLKELKEIALAEKVVHRLTEQDRAAQKAALAQQGKPGQKKPAGKNGQPPHPAQPQNRPVQSAQNPQIQNSAQHNPAPMAQNGQNGQPAQPQSKPADPVQKTSPQNIPAQMQNKPVEQVKSVEAQKAPEQNKPIAQPQPAKNGTDNTKN